MQPSTSLFPIKSCQVKSSGGETQELSEMSIYDNIQWDVWINPFIDAVWCWLYSKRLTRGKGFVIRISRKITQTRAQTLFPQSHTFLLNINTDRMETITHFMSYLSEGLSSPLKIYFLLPSPSLFPLPSNYFSQHITFYLKDVLRVHNSSEISLHTHGILITLNLIDYYQETVKYLHESSIFIFLASIKVLFIST